MSPPSRYIIETHGLSKSFGDVQALRDLDLTVPEHSITGFLGPNGAGKTTTIRLLLGLNRPTAGRGSIFGHDIVEENVEIRKRVGYLAQQPRFYSDMTAREILRFTAHTFFKDPDKGYVYALRTVGDSARARERVANQPWVSNLSVNAVDGASEWRVAVTDEHAARSQLLRLVLATGIWSLIFVLVALWRFERLEF